MVLRSCFAPFVSPAVLAVLLAGTPQFALAQTTAAPANANTKGSQQSNPLVHLAVADVQTLAGALRALVKQAPGVSFVAEGKPFRARNSAPPLVFLVQKWPADGLPLDEAVQKIAAIYDYQAERKGDVFLLRKRYTNPNDLPEVTTEELRLALRDASRAASALPAPTVPPASFTDVNSPFMADLFHSLKPSQQPVGFRGMGGGETVKIADLNARQKDAVWQCAVSRHIQAATGKSITAFKVLQTLERSGTFFGMQDIENAQRKMVRIFAYTPKRLDTAIFPSFAYSGHFWNNEPVPADYAVSGAPLPFFEPAEGAGIQSLQKFCDSGGKTSRFTVDPALASKNVLMILPPQKVEAEEAQTLREAVFRAVGDVYGLRVLHLPNDTFHLTRGRVVTAQTVADLNTTVPAAFPEPLMRAFHGAIAVETEKSLARYREERAKDTERTSNSNPEQKVIDEIDIRAAKREGRAAGDKALRNAVLRRFRVLVEPRVAGGKTVVFADLGQEEERLLLLALASECLEDVDKLSGELPPPTRKALEQGHISSITMGNEVFFLDKVPKEMENTCRFIFYLHLADKNGDVRYGSSYSVGNVTVPIPPEKAE